MSNKSIHTYNHILYTQILSQKSHNGLTRLQLQGRMQRGRHQKSSGTLGRWFESVEGTPNSLKEKKERNGMKNGLMDVGFG